MSRNLIILASLATALAACSSGPRPEAGLYRPTGPAGTAAAAPEAPNPAYQIGPLDVLRIDVLQEPELTVDRLPVDPDGDIQMPLAGRIHVADQTAGQAASAIATRLRPYLRNPQVAVNLVEILSSQVTVEGEVRQAGVFVAPRPISLTRSVALAQGVSQDAQLKDVYVFRTVAGQDYAARFDLGAIQKGEAPDPTVRPGDTVIVGTDQARRRFRDALTVLPIVFGLFIAIVK